MLEEKFEQKTMYTATGETHKTLTCKVYTPVPLIKASEKYNPIHIFKEVAPYEKYPLLNSRTKDRYELQSGIYIDTTTSNKNESGGYSLRKVA
jgi:hypothetical protein